MQHQDEESLEQPGQDGVSPLVRRLTVLFILLVATHPIPARASTMTVLREAAVSAALLGGAFALDHAVHPGFPDEGPGFLVEEPGEATGGATLLFGGTAALAAEGLALHKHGSLETAKDLGLALAATSGFVTLLKLATHRERPDRSDDLSFPSGHTAVAFAAATVIDRRYGGVAGWLAYAAAAAAGEARLADDHHYLSDVVAGALIGRLIGRLVTKSR